MRIVFVGPSLAGASADADGIELRPPAKQGDLARAVLEGATVIGLVDGLFGSAASVWHKEILYALDCGVRVLGSSSMGALRAAECAAYGMEPVGYIAHRYLSGDLDDDAAVALCHLPAELGWAPLTQPLVDVEATIAELLRKDAITNREAALIWRVAGGCHFTVRTIDQILAATPFADGRRPAIAELYRRYRRSIKQEDALSLLAAVKSIPAVRADRPQTWKFEKSPMWVEQLRIIDQAG